MGRPMIENMFRKMNMKWEFENFNYSGHQSENITKKKKKKLENFHLTKFYQSISIKINIATNFI